VIGKIRYYPLPITYSLAIMLYLAQIHKNDFLDQYQLRLLARQESKNFWLTISEEMLILLGKGNFVKLDHLYKSFPVSDWECYFRGSALSVLI
jgi:hypothetical protein